MSTTATETTAPTPTPLKSWESPVSHFEKNVADVLGELANFIPWRHEGEFNRVMLAVTHLSHDLEELLKNPEPVAPGQSGPDPALAAVIKRQNETDDKLNQILALLQQNQSLSTTVAEPSTPESGSPAEPVVAPTEPTTPAEVPFGPGA